MGVIRFYHLHFLVDLLDPAGRNTKKSQQTHSNSKFVDFQSSWSKISGNNNEPTIIVLKKTSNR
jgi:hypothetical protein